jgi:hypothetical protein
VSAVSVTGAGSGEEAASEGPAETVGLAGAGAVADAGAEGERRADGSPGADEHAVSIPAPTSVIASIVARVLRAMSRIVRAAVRPRDIRDRLRQAGAHEDGRCASASVS